MPIEAVKIPQNVYVEDRIIGPVTLKQLAIVGAGAGLSYILYSFAAKAGAGVPVQIACWTPTVIAAAFAFLKINDLSLFNIILLMIEGMQKPTTRFWSPHAGLSINIITRQAAKELTTKNDKLAESASRLADVTRQLEKRQEAMNALAAHEDPKPDNVDGIKTKFAQAMEPSLPEEPVSVNPERVSTDGLDQARSIDGLRTHLA